MINFQTGFVSSPISNLYFMVGLCSNYKERSLFGQLFISLLPNLVVSIHFPKLKYFPQLCFVSEHCRLTNVSVSGTEAQTFSAFPQIWLLHCSLLLCLRRWLFSSKSHSSRKFAFAELEFQCHLRQGNKWERRVTYCSIKQSQSEYQIHLHLWQLRWRWWWKRFRKLKRHVPNHEISTRE